MNFGSWLRAPERGCSAIDSSKDANMVQEGMMKMNTRHSTEEATGLHTLVFTSHLTDKDLTMFLPLSLCNDSKSLGKSTCA